MSTFFSQRCYNVVIWWNDVATSKQLHYNVVTTSFVYWFIWPWQRIGFKSFAKILRRSCVFCCSDCIRFNPTSHLNHCYSSSLLQIDQQTNSDNTKRITIVSKTPKNVRKKREDFKTNRKIEQRKEQTCKPGLYSICKLVSVYKS